LLPVSVIELMFMEKARIQSDGESPRLTWTAVFGVDVGIVPMPEELPLLHALRAKVKSSRQHKAAMLCSVGRGDGDEFPERMMSSWGKARDHGLAATPRTLAEGNLATAM
jgi:hypothetical protein